MTQQAGPNWDRLPAELRWARQWVLAAPDKAPWTVTQDGQLARASVTDPRTWLDFETAVAWAAHTGYGVGYVLADDDPFSCVDLDVKDTTTQDDLSRYWRIAQGLASYCERSRSGRGLHIWVRGKIGSGKRRGNIEVYSRERYIICTGDVVLDLPIEDRQDLLTQFVDEMLTLNRNDGEEPIPDQAEVADDAVIIQRAMGADNAAKFNELCCGRWEQYGYPSQSEADLALLSMFTFYSPSNEQCKRLFRMTALGRREKAVRNDKYLDSTLRTIRQRQAREQKHHAAIEAGALLTRAAALVGGAGPVEAAPAGSMAPAAAVATLAPQPAHAASAKVDELEWPPGFVGAVAGYIFRSAPRPVREVAIVGALGLVAGICGRTWMLPQSGLNIYLILVARSAIGKEALHSGISSLVNKLAMQSPNVTQFVDFSDFASGPALTKAVAAQPCFVNVAGEWGKKLQRLALESRVDGPMQQLRTVMTNLYQKSGPSAIVGGISYSNKDNNIASVSGVAYSMVGESTPGTFYDSLTDTMMEDGFLSRFTVVEYTGDRPPENPDQQLEPDAALLHHLRGLCEQSITMQHNPNARILVQRDDAARDMLKAFDLECDNAIHAAGADESKRQMWNRASLKAQRCAALLAVADNPMNPWINTTHATWALKLIRKDIQIMQQRMSSGDIGNDDHTRESKVLALLREYTTQGVSPGYRVPALMVQSGIIPRRVIQTRTARLSAFTTHRDGAHGALERTLRTMLDNGYIAEAPAPKITEAYGPGQGKCFYILNTEQAK